ncbi:nitrate- and nitrite sensing domain-containing protein [Streptosporangium sp. NPDC002721]|uniref:sensor histidine kinase n=1 Tax=Streptosporangium sp. NPDC002721 TaxID=3366188 RepID=UPI0036D1D472
MRLRNASLRTKVTALLVSLTALWAFTAWVTVRDGLNMLGVATLNTEVADPSERLIVELQAERRLTAITLGSPGTERQRREALAAQRKRTDAADAHFRKLTGGNAVGLLGTPALERRIGETGELLDGLTAARKAIDAGRVNRTWTAAEFTAIVDSIFRVYDSLATLDDEELAKDTRTLIGMNRARDMLAQEDALVMGALTAGRFADGEQIRFTQMVGTRRFITEQAVAELPAADQEAHRRMVAEGQFTRLRAMEDQLIQNPEVVQAGLIDVTRWSSDAQPAQTRFTQAVLTAGSGVVERSGPVAAGVLVRLALAGGLGLVAVIASVVLAITTARALVQQLEKLRAAAWELANERLPAVVERIGHGQVVDVAAEAPPLKFGDDQIGQVGQAFNAVQRTAIKVAAEQAQLRRDIADILRNLARRTQSLVHRQLSVLDVMERRENDPQELRDLFRLDHLATRMRRYAENLLVLSGAAPGRAWRDAVPMIDVVRGSLAEIEDYTRVDVMPLGEVSLDGRAVSDVIHLIAELVENAASFSPPYTTVQVGGYLVAHGYALEIEDRGLGMSAADIADANERIANPPELKLSGNARLGLYVVSRLAERHDIRVTFKSSPYGGTTVIVLIPQGLVKEEDPGPSVGVGVPQARPASSAEMNGGTSATTAVRGRVSDPLGIAGGPGRVAGAEGEVIGEQHVPGGSDVWKPAPPANGRSHPAGPAPSGLLPGPASSGGLPDPASAGGFPDQASSGGFPDQASPGGFPGQASSGGLADPAPSGRHSAGPAPAEGYTDPTFPGRFADPSALRQMPETGTRGRLPDFTNSGSGASGGLDDSGSHGRPGGSGTSLPPVLPPPDSSHTPGGLPRRVPQTHLAAPLQEDEPVAPPPVDDTDGRSPEMIREAMSSFQAGTRRGRDDAAQLLDRDGDPADEGGPAV